MKIIPVIDLKDGLVVHAREGNRAQYLPLKTTLCKSAGVIEIIQALITAFPVDTLYVADLNAITGTGNHDRLIHHLTSDYPELMFWVDQGYRPYQKTAAQTENYRPVLGSESYRNSDVDTLKAYDKRFILSLDYAKNEALGASKLFSCPELWPDTIIIMMLDRVGSGTGPDLAKLTEFRKQYPNKNFIAAGGIRNRHDLHALQSIGVDQALVASALHSGVLGADDLAMFQTKKYPG